jgi:hypothetical protein
MNITQEDFIRYEIVREEGHYNMFDSRAIEKTGLKRDTYIHIIANYDKYASKWK